VNYTCVPYVW